jgi:hypothetical protein
MKPTLRLVALLASLSDRFGRAPIAAGKPGAIRPGDAGQPVCRKH